MDKLIKPLFILLIIGLLISLSIPYIIQKKLQNNNTKTEYECYRKRFYVKNNEEEDYNIIRVNCKSIMLNNL